MSEMPGMFSGPAMSTGQHALIARQGTEPAGGNYAGQSYPGQGYAGQGYPGQGYAGQGYPGQGNPGQSYPEQSGPGQSSPGQSHPGQSMPLRAQTAPSAYAPSISDPNLALVSQPVVALRRSALGVFGWLVLAAVLFGGVGALLYIALGERTAATKASEVVPSAVGSARTGDAKAIPPKSEAEGSVHGSAEPPHVPDAVTGSDGVGDDGTPDPARSDGKKPGDDKPHKRPPTRTAAIGKRSGPSADDKPAPLLVKEAKALEKAYKWTEARAVYQRLEKAKGYNYGEALYRQAYAAFQAKLTGDVVDLAGKAMEQPGPFRVQAQFLFADALYKEGEFGRAKNVYNSIYNNQKGDEKTAAEKKIKACNRELKLPEADGVGK